MPNDEQAGVISLVCGILSWITCPFILAIVAIYVGSGNRNGMAQAGVLLGWINIIVTLGGFAIVVLLGLLSLVFGT